MRFVSLRASGAVYRIWPEALPTPTRSAFLIPPGYPVVEADGRTWSNTFPVVAFFWPGLYYQVFLLLRAEQPAYYVNVITPMTRLRDVIYFIDLDLDVIVQHGVPMLVDEEEFAQRRGGYGAAQVTGAIRAVEQIFALVTRNQGVFSSECVSAWRHYAATATSVNGARGGQS